MLSGYIVLIEIDKLLHDMKPSSRIKSIARHTIVWLIWFGIQSYTLFAAGFSTFGTMDWLFQAFNYFSLIIVFYTLAYFIAHFVYDGIDGEYLVRKDLSAFSNIFSVELVSIFLVIVLYIIVGVSLDTKFLGYKYPGVDAYVYARLEIVLPYVVYAYFYAFYRMTKKIRQKMSNEQKEKDIPKEMN